MISNMISKIIVLSFAFLFADAFVRDVTNIGNVISLPNNCNCAYRNGSITFDAMKSQGKQRMIDIIQTISGYPLKGFKVMNSFIHSIPTSCPALNGVENMEVKNSSLKKLFDRKPSSESNLKDIRCENVTFQQSSEESSQESSEESVSTDQNESRNSFDFKMLKDCNKLRKVEFLNTKVMNFEEALKTKQDMKEIIMKNVGLTMVSEKSVPERCPNLEKINFSNNKIQSISIDSFVTMPKLKEVNVASNNISRFMGDLIPFLNKPTLQSFKVEDNPIDCCSVRPISDCPCKAKVSGTCTHPPQLQGREINSLTQADFEPCP